MTQTYKKKLIEVAIPLKAINEEAAKEKSSPFLRNHTRSLHQWWARRPLTASRAILLSQLLDDPSSHPEMFRSEEEIAAERTRLFQLVEDVCKWENNHNSALFSKVLKEIERSCDGKIPPALDPFSGGGTIPGEAQRLGIMALASDLNPVAVMIAKAMIEIPTKFSNCLPANPSPNQRTNYVGTDGIAEDVEYYGRLVQERASKNLSNAYPKYSTKSGAPAEVIGWVWTRTVPSPDPAFRGAVVPIASSFLLSSKKGAEVCVMPEIDQSNGVITFHIQPKPSAAEILEAKQGTKQGRGASFRCLLSGAAINPDYVKRKSNNGEMSVQQMAIVAQVNGRKTYLPPNKEQEALSKKLTFDQSSLHDIVLPKHPQYVGVGNYGFKTYSDLFLPRQLLVLTELGKQIQKVKDDILDDCRKRASVGLPLAEGGSGAKAYSEAISVYLSFAMDKLADYGNTLCGWNPINQNIRQLFARQAISMSWDFVEANPFGPMVSFEKFCAGVAGGIRGLRCAENGAAFQADAAAPSVLHEGVLISTDPPYYDNVPYADISDFFFMWMKENLKSVYPDIFSTVAVPKADELVADRMRHGGASPAEDFFLKGMTKALENCIRQSDERFPAAIYYAFKQSEISSEGTTSTGWAAFLEAVISSGYSIVATWPVRTEREARTRAIGSNALANSVVLVCRKKEISAESITRAEFIRALKRELPPAIAELQAANIAPADMPQSAIGPGMGVFSRYKAVLESDDSHMSVKTALQLINAELDEFLGGIQGEFDPDTRFAISWFEQNGMGKGDFGLADSLARARGIAVESVKHAGIVESQAGKVRILKRDELDPEWEPQKDTHLTVWECLQYLVRAHEKDGISYNTALLLRKIDDKAEAVKDLAYCLYDICANKRQDAKEATAYNALIADWSDLTREAAAIVDIRGTGQTRMNF